MKRWPNGWGERSGRTGNGHWPREMYVREARRMVSNFVIAEPHLRGTKPTPRPIGMGSYNVDSHMCSGSSTGSFVRNEGNIEVGPGRAYPISYDAIVPRKRETENLLVPVALSASHIAYDSIRMEPVFMILGQSAAAAAAAALDRGKAVQDITMLPLRARLVADGQILEMERSASPVGAAAPVRCALESPGILRGKEDRLGVKSGAPPTLWAYQEKSSPIPLAACPGLIWPRRHGATKMNDRHEQLARARTLVSEAIAICDRLGIKVGGDHMHLGLEQLNDAEVPIRVHSPRRIWHARLRDRPAFGER